MSETLLIFRKDVRRFWWEISVLLALMAWLAYLDSPFASRGQTITMLTLLEFVVSLASWFVIGLAIQEEKLTGERAYWLTRPIHRSSLLIAKLLFIAAFVMFPTLLAQLATLLRGGLSPWAHRSDLLAYHVFLAATLIVIAVVASVVASMSGLVSALLGGAAMIVAGALGVGSFLSWLSRRLPVRSRTPVDVTRETYFIVCLIGAAALAALAFHYLRRHTTVARIWLVALAIFQGAAIMLSATDFDFADRFLPASDSPLPGGKPTLSFDPTREPPPVKIGPNFISQVHIPIRIDGLSPGMLVAGASIDYRIQSPGEQDYHETMHSLSGIPASGLWLDAVSNGPAWLRLNIGRSYEHEAPTQHFHARLRLVLLEVRTVEVPLSSTPTRVMKDARCYTVTSARNGLLTCSWPMQRPDYIRVLNPPPPSRPEDRANYFTARDNSILFVPAPGGQTVWEDTTTQIPPFPATVEARWAGARFERTLDIPSITIWKYTTPGDRFFEGLSQQP